MPSRKLKLVTIRPVGLPAQCEDEYLMLLNLGRILISC
jgi:hypothetical protein